MMDGESWGGNNQRALPHNFEAEKALLGSIMMRNDCLDTVLQAGLRSEHFADGIHSRIFDALEHQIDTKKMLATPITLREWFENDGALEGVGGARYLGELAASMVSVVNIADYAKLIIDECRKREIIDFGERLTARAYAQDYRDTADKILADAETEMSELAEAKTAGMPEDSNTQIRLAVDGIEAARRAKEEGRPVGRSTGLVALDRIIGGFKPGRLYVVAARPSMGKSALAVKFAEAGGQCFCYSGEMPAGEWHERRLGIAAKVPPERLGNGDVTREEIERIAECSLALDRGVFVDDTPRLTMAAFRRRALRHAEKHPTSLIVADHLGKFAWADPDGRETRELGLITGGCKDLAKEMGVPLVLLVQLNRGVEGRDDKRPGMGDLRGSGNIEEDADVVAFLYREAYYLERMPPMKKEHETDEAYNKRMVDHAERLEKVRRIADIALAKNRGGQLGVAKTYWKGELMMFGDLRRDLPGAEDLQQGMDL